MRLRARSLLWRLFFTLVVALSALLIAAGVAIYQYARQESMQTIDRQLRTQVLFISTATYQKANNRIELYFSDHLLREFDDDDDRGAFFQMWRQDGEVVERSDSLLGENLPRRLGEPEAPRYWLLDLPTARRGRAIGISFTPRANPGDREHFNPRLDIGLVVALDIEEDLQRLADLKLAIAVFIGIALVAVSIVLWLTLRRELTPLRELAQNVAQLDPARPDRQALTRADPPRELAPVVDQLDELVARFRQALARERQLSSDIAHELRTPLSELRTTLEVYRKWGKQTTAEMLDDALASISGLERIMQTLLSLNRLESSGASLQYTRLDLVELVRQAWMAHTGAAERRGLTVTLDLPESASLDSDESMLLRILDNVLSNAASHADAGGRIRVSIEKEDKTIVLEVANTCQGLEQADLPKMEDPFWQKDASRADRDHAGLGLAIVKKCADLLGLQMRFELRGDDLVTRIAFPRTHDCAKAV